MRDERGALDNMLQPERSDALRELGRPGPAARPEERHPNHVFIDLPLLDELGESTEEREGIAKFLGHEPGMDDLEAFAGWLREHSFEVGLVVPVVNDFDPVAGQLRVTTEKVAA